MGCTRFICCTQFYLALSPPQQGNSDTEMIAHGCWWQSDGLGRRKLQKTVKVQRNEYVDAIVELDVQLTVSLFHSHPCCCVGTELLVQACQGIRTVVSIHRRGPIQAVYLLGRSTKKENYINQ